MSNPRDELNAMAAAYDALAPLPADQKAAVLTAVMQELEVRDFMADIDAAEARGLEDDG